MYTGLCSIVLKHFCRLSMLANLLCPKHDGGDDNFGYHVLDSAFLVLFVCFFLPLCIFFLLQLNHHLQERLACLSC